MYKISLFDAAFDATKSNKVSEVVEANFTNLANLVTLRMWSPGTFKDNYRTIGNFESLQLLVLDIDEGLTIEEAKAVFAPYELIIGTSRNHNKEKITSGGKVRPAAERFRIIISLSERITNDSDFKATWFSAQALCPQIDPACKDSSRFFYPCVEIVHVQKGQSFRVVKAPAQSVQSLNPISQSLPSKQRSSASSPARGKLSKRAISFLHDGADPWHPEFVFYVKDCKQQQYTFDEMRDLFCKFYTPDATDEAQFVDLWNRPVRHAARTEHEDREALLKIIMDSHLITSIERPYDDYFCVNLETGLRKKIHLKVIASLLGKDDLEDYMNNRRVLCDFVYGPTLPLLGRNAENGATEFNTYVPPEWARAAFLFNEPLKRIDTLPAPYSVFFKHLTDGDMESFNYVIDWLATSLQSRNLTILTAIGKQGVGKGTLGEVLELLHGESNYRKVRDQIFKAQFNSALNNKTLVHIDEIALDTDESVDRIKDVVNKSVEIEEKGKDSKSVRNHASYYICSNKLGAIPIEGGDRRFSVIQLTDTRVMDASDAVKAAMHAIIKPENIAELACYLMSHKPKHSMMHPFHSKIRFNEVRDARLTEWEDYVVNDWCTANAGKQIPLTELQLDIERKTMLRRGPGRLRMLDLAQRYPDRLQMVQGANGRRFIRVMKAAV